MSAISDPMNQLVPILRTRLTGALPMMMRAAIAPFDDETIWWKPASSINPVAVLALHCAGNLRHFVGRYVGGAEYERDRQAEFDASRRLSKAEVLAEFDAAIAEVEATFAKLDGADYFQPSRDPEDRHGSIYEDLLNATVHLALHTGQAIQLARLHGYELGSDIWGNAHRSSGTWRSRKRIGND